MFLAVRVSCCSVVSSHSLVMVLIMAEVTGSVIMVGMITGVVVAVPRMINGVIRVSGVSRIGIAVVSAAVRGWVLAVNTTIRTPIRG
jgi:hypothetical protein